MQTQSYILSPISLQFHCCAWPVKCCIIHSVEIPVARYIMEPVFLQNSYMKNRSAGIVRKDFGINFRMSQFHTWNNY
jgi:hypothetical protein